MSVYRDLTCINFNMHTKNWENWGGGSDVKVFPIKSWIWKTVNHKACFKIAHVRLVIVSTCSGKIYKNYTGIPVHVVGITSLHEDCVLKHLCIFCRFHRDATSSDATPPSSPTLSRRARERPTDDNVFSRLTSNTQPPTLQPPNR